MFPYFIHTLFSTITSTLLAVNVSYLPSSNKGRLIFTHVELRATEYG